MPALKVSQKPAVRDNRGTPPHPDPPPKRGEMGFFRLTLPLGGWGRGAFPRIGTQSCYDFWSIPSLETFSNGLPSRIPKEFPYEPRSAQRGGSAFAWEIYPAWETGYRKSVGYAAGRLFTMKKRGTHSTLSEDWPGLKLFERGLFRILGTPYIVCRVRGSSDRVSVVSPILLNPPPALRGIHRRSRASSRPAQWLPAHSTRPRNSGTDDTSQSTTYKE